MIAKWLKNLSKALQIKTEIRNEFELCKIITKGKPKKRACFGWVRLISKTSSEGLEEDVLNKTLY